MPRAPVRVLAGAARSFSSLIRSRERRLAHTVEAADERLSLVEERPRLIPQGCQYRIFRFAQPRHDVRLDAVLLFIGPATAPVEQRDAARLEITERVPVQVLIRPPLLA